jgi:hypothetical protein
MAGTPFDDQINQLYKNWRAEQQKARMPLVTVLRARRGTVIGYTVTPSPWRVEMPPWPPEPPIVKAAPETAPTPKVQTSTVPSLIVTGKKTNPADTTNSSETVTPTRESALLSVASPAPDSATNAPAGLAVSDASRIVSSQKLPANSASEVTILERKVERPAESPQHASEPAPTLPKEPVASPATTSKPESVSPALHNRSNASTPAPAETAQKFTPPSPDIPTGVTLPRNNLLSNKVICLAGVALLGITCVVLIGLGRRPGSQHVSLITHSLEREKND